MKTVRIRASWDSFACLSLSAVYWVVSMSILRAHNLHKWIPLEGEDRSSALSAGLARGPLGAAEWMCDASPKEMERPGSEWGPTVGFSQRLQR